jgi:hypothetical protein
LKTNLNTLAPIVRALWFLQSRSWANQAKVRLRRLKQPKYLIGAIVGISYFSTVLLPGLFGAFGHRGHGVRTVMAPQQSLRAGEELMALGLLVWTLMNWILPSSRAALQFNEAELAFLLPAPATRRMLIQYRILKTILPLLFTSLIFSLFSWRLRQQPWLIRILGWWIVMITLRLHIIGAGFTMTRLLDSGLTPWRRRAAIFAVLLLLGGGCIFTIGRSLPDFPKTFEDFLGAPTVWLNDAVSTAPLRWILYPFHLIAAPRFSQTFGSFALCLPGALLVMALHYVWVIKSEVSFEEASLQLAQQRAVVVAAVRQGRHPLTLGKRRKIRAPFKLSPTGFAPIALMWKNLVAAGSGFNPRIFIFLGIWFAMSGGGIVTALNASGHGGVAASVLALDLLAFGIVLLLGPQLARYDLRHDLQSIDLVKLYPLPGWQVVLGELLAPAFILTCIQWILLLVAALFSHNTVLDDALGSDLGVAGRWSLAVAVAVIVPGFNLAALIVPNGITLLFPAWVQIGKEGPMGLEVMGQRMVMAIGAFLALAVGLLPASIVFGLLFAGANWAIGWYAGILFGALGALTMLLAEAALGIVLLGKAFERLDLT